MEEIFYQYFRPKDGKRSWKRILKLFRLLLMNIGWVLLILGLLIMIDKLGSMLGWINEGLLVNHLKETTIVGYPFFGKISYLYMETITAMDFFFACVLAPLWEEFTFRYAPFAMFIAPKLIKHPGMTPEQWEHNKRYVKRNLGLMVVLTSILFGILHGGPMNLLFQGVGGLILWKVFLQSGKYRYWYAVGAHALWNISVSVGLFIITG